MGRWIDFGNDYKTLYPWFMESIWWATNPSIILGLLIFMWYFVSMYMYLQCVINYYYYVKNGHFAQNYKFWQFSSYHHSKVPRALGLIVISPGASSPSTKESRVTNWNDWASKWSRYQTTKKILSHVTMPTLNMGSIFGKYSTMIEESKLKDLATL